MEFRLTFLILLPLGLAAAAVYAYGIRPAWKRVIERCEDLDDRDACGKAQREAAERELRDELQGDEPR